MKALDGPFNRFRLSVSHTTSNGSVTESNTQALLNELAQASTFMSFRVPVLWQSNLRRFALADQTDASVIIREALKEWAERRNRNIAGFL